MGADDERIHELVDNPDHALNLCVGLGIGYMVAHAHWSIGLHSETFQASKAAITSSCPGSTFGYRIQSQCHRISPEHLIYADPPYMPDTRTAKKAYGPHEMTPLQHFWLVGALFATVVRQPSAAQRALWDAMQKILE
jgi:hypothetical protein